jgi:hypothetical protein
VPGVEKTTHLVALNVKNVRRQTMSDKILGVDGEVHPENSQPEQQQMTSTQFCAGVLSAYVDQMAQNGLDPVNALIEMGVQVPSAMIQFIKFHTEGVTSHAEEPLKILLQEIAAVSQKFGFRMMFQLSYAGEPEGEKENDGTESDSGDTKDGCCSGCDCGNECTGTCDDTGTS